MSCLNGKSAPLNRPGAADPDRFFVAAVERQSGVVRGQIASHSAAGETSAARRLIADLDVAGRTLTLHALHSCPKTAQRIIHCRAHYVLPVKRNHPALLQDIRQVDILSLLY